MALLTLSDALAQLRDTLPTPTQAETISLAAATHRVCAADIYSPINVPNFDNAAMDGYGVRSADFAAGLPVLTCVGNAFAGNPFQGEIQAGECVRITTGAPIPAGVDAVVMVEDTEAKGTQIHFSRSTQAGENVRYIGEDIQQGALVVEKGTPLNVAVLPLLASLGITEVSVYPRLKVAFFSTGDELAEIGQPLQTGQIYDTNRFTLRLLLEKCHCELLDLGILPDDPEQFERAFSQAQQQADVVITSGGVSMGEMDFTKKVLEKLGNVGFWKLAIKPGKPFAFGKLQKAWFFGLPGNPVSALVTFYQLALPALQRLSGIKESVIAAQQQQIPAIAAEKLKKKAGRLDFQRGFYFVNDEGQIAVRAVGNQGSHIFSAFAESNCFIVLEQMRGNVEAGERVIIQPFNALLQ